MRLALVLLAAGCLPQFDRPDGDDGDSDVVEDDSEFVRDPGPPCDATRTLDLTLVPDLPGRQPMSWKDHDVTLSTEAWDGLEARRHEDGCLHLAPGTLRIRTLPTRCAVSEVRVRLIDACGPTCTALEVLDEDDVAASARNSRSDAEETLRLAPLEPFVELVLRSRDVAICAVELVEAPLPERLRPDDTAALF